jgi:hypothetical protein
MLATTSHTKIQQAQESPHVVDIGHVVASKLLMMLTRRRKIQSKEEFASQVHVEPINWLTTAA